MFGVASRGIPSFGDKSWKMPVDLVTVAPLSPANTYTPTSGNTPAKLVSNVASSTIVDGVTVTVGMRVLVRNEAIPSHNGIYICTNQGSAAPGDKYTLVRAADAWLARLLPNGSTVFANSGNANSQTFFVLASAIANIDTDQETWVVQNSNANINRRAFTATGTYTPPTDPSFFGVLVRCIGAGGGGGGVVAAASGQHCQGGGGGSGGYSESFISAGTLGTTPVTVTVGTGGSGGTTAGTGGGSGGATSFGTFVKANGGGGGTGASGSSATAITSSQGGVGASSTGAIGDFFFAGAPGGYGVGGAGNATSGPGGSGPFGGGGRAVNSNSGGTSGNGNSADANTGSGGSGAFSNSAGSAASGGAGADGIVLILEFYSS